MTGRQCGCVIMTRFLGAILQLDRLDRLALIIGSREIQPYRACTYSMHYCGRIQKVRFMRSTRSSPRRPIRPVKRQHLDTVATLAMSG